MGLHGLHESILIDALPTLKVAHFSGSQARVDARGTFETAGKRALHPLERANLKANAPEVKDFLQKVKLSRLEVRCGELVETARCCPRFGFRTRGHKRIKSAASLLSCEQVCRIVASTKERA
jgi:hypothetical protein